MKRKDVIKMVKKRILQAVALSNHVRHSKGTDAFVSEDYVAEKSRTNPALDLRNKNVFDRLVEILNQEYGLELTYYE
jgi:hypothetical protein